LSFLLTGLGMYVIGALLNSQGDTRTTLKINLLNLAISMPLALILIPTHGVTGLIISILASQLISTVFGLHQVHRIYDMNIEWASSLKIVVASLLSALPAWILIKLIHPTNPIYGLALGGALYLTSFLVCAPVTGAVDLEDIENLEGLTSQLPTIRHIAGRVLQAEKKILEFNIL